MKIIWDWYDIFYDYYPEFTQDKYIMVTLIDDQKISLIFVNAFLKEIISNKLTFINILW